MKILFLNHNLIWRGTFFRCLGFARELVKRGHEVDLWTTSRERNWLGTQSEISGVRVWQTPRWGKLGKHDGGYALVDNLSRLYESTGGRWDIIHAFDHRPNVLLPWRWLRFGIRVLIRDPNPLFVSDWSDWWTGGGITTERRPFAWMDRIERGIEEGSKLDAECVTAISSVLYQRALDIGVPEDSLLHLPSGVSVENFPTMHKMDCRRSLNLPQDRKFLGFVGYSLWDLELLAEIFDQVKKRVPTAALLVIGGGVEEEAKMVFHARFKVGEDVFLPGVVPFSDIPAYLGACDAQVLPMKDTLANRARFPNKLTDYYASARPVVVPDIGDAGNLVREQKTGIVAGSDAESLAKACVKLLQDAQMAKACGERARKIAETTLSFSHLTDKLLRFYESRRVQSLSNETKETVES